MTFVNNGEVLTRDTATPSGWKGVRVGDQGKCVWRNVEIVGPVDGQMLRVKMMDGPPSSPGDQLTFGHTVFEFGDDGRWHRLSGGEL